MASTRAQRRHPDRHLDHAAVLATLSAGSHASLTADSIASTMRQDGTRPERERWFARDSGGTIFIISGPRIAETRSQIVDKFLGEDCFAKASWLVMVDADMVFDGADVFALLDAADPVERPIVGGLCFAGYTPDTMYPTIYVADRDDDGRLDIDKVRDYPRDQLVRCHATGAAFVAVHRSVFEAMRRPHDQGGFGTLPNGAPNPYPWFVEGHTDRHGRPFGEDIAFCLRAGALGFPVHVHTGIKVGHHKSIILTEELYQR